jgi:fibronectin type 3 domain-containing protein
VTVTVSPPPTATLTWDAVADERLAGYRIYYGTAPGKYDQPPGQGVIVDKGTTTYTVTVPRSGAVYFFAVTAYDEMDNESDYSNEAFKYIP